MSSRVCFSFALVSRMRTSSIHRRHATLVFVLGILIPRVVPCISLFISSISRAYCSTDRTPPCRMLSLIWIFLVGPNFVWIVAVRFSLSFFIIAHIWEFIPLLIITYMMASIHALSYAFVTSRNVAYTGCFCVLAALIASLRISRWSVVALPFWPPAWASVISAIRVALLFTILSKSFPMLLANVMPLSFEHFPLVPLPLYSRVMFPFSHWGGISLFLSILLNMFRYIYLVA